jgi:asparagine synthase (glutamine-hydrolysing)
MLSGGVDSSILASILRPDYAVTCSFGPDSPDGPYAEMVGKKFCASHCKVVISFEKMLDLADRVVKISKTFDPTEIRNSVVALAAIEQAKADGYDEIMTGDGGDELFAGYNYLSRYYSDFSRLDSEVRRLWRVMHFSSQDLGAHLGVKIVAPYLDPDFARFAMSLPVETKVGEKDGKQWGKFLLRSCYEKELGPAIAWRPKLAQEQGAGTERFQQYINERIDDSTFSSKSRIAKSEGVVLRSKEHLHYYALFRSYFPPPRQEEGMRRCPDCQANIDSESRYCRRCGAFPVRPVELS